MYQLDGVSFDDETGEIHPLLDRLVQVVPGRAHGTEPADQPGRSPLVPTVDIAKFTVT